MSNKQDTLIDIQPFLDKLHLLGLYMENKIYCIGTCHEILNMGFEEWLKEVVPGTQYEYLIPGSPKKRPDFMYWITNNKL